MKVLFFLALLGSALAFQGPIEYRYKYAARIGTGIQSGRPQYAGTGLRADVKITIDQEGEALFEVSNVKVGERNEIVGNAGRDEIDIEYRDIVDKSIQQPFKAHYKRRDGETVMEVPQNDLLWVTNVRRGIVNFFRVAPICDPSSVRPLTNPSGELEPQTISRFEDTYAGRCRVSYTLSHASVYDIPRPLREDVQSKSARKSSAGGQVKLEEEMYNLKTSIDFDTCSDRVALLQTGAANLTNVTSSSFRDAATRVYYSQHILKGSPGKFRIESGIVESEFLLNPFGIESDRMVVVSNQTASLQSALPVPRKSRSLLSLKPINTWRHQIQSPNSKPQGYCPRWVLYRKENEQGFSPIFYERLATGFGWPSTTQEKYRIKVRNALKQAAHRLDYQNRDCTEEPKEYRGSDDGRAAQELQFAHKIIRTLTKDQLQKLDTEMEQCGSTVARDLYYETLAVAASGPALDVLFDKIQSQKISDNRTASIFFTLGNNIQSPEVLDKMMKFVMSLKEQDRVIVSLLAKVNFATLVRRLCVSPYIRAQSHMQYVYGDKMCDRSKIVGQYLPHLESRITSQSPIWVKILNTIAAGDLGARESLTILEKVARGHVSGDKFLRFAAIHAMGYQTFDNTSRDQIFNILQPIAESHVEDYRIRQICYDTLLSWKPNVTFIQRMALHSNTEPSVQIQSFIYWVIDSMSRIDDPSYRELANAARHLRPITKYVNPSSSRAMYYTDSRYVFEDKAGALGNVAWLTQFKESFPREIYTYLVGKYGNVEVPLFESITFGNTDPPFLSLHKAVEDFTKPSSDLSGKRNSQLPRGSGEQEPDIYYYLKMFRTSEAFLPLTSKLYDSARRYVSQASNRMSQPERVISYKYLNPIESNVILPSPVGIFFHLESSSPTILYSNMVITSKSEPATENPRQLPVLDRINIRVKGIAKAVFKVNTYSYVLAPWTNKTVMAAIDNEKSISMPMDCEAEAQLKNPAQILWGKITPTYNQTQERIPVLKVRNMPFTAIGGLLPSPVLPQEISDFKQVRWLYSPEQETHLVYPIPEESTGLKAEIDYRGEAVPPFYQPNIYNYLIDEPSRLLTLLASPTIKAYDLTLYKKTERSPTKSFGCHVRFLEQQGKPSGGDLSQVEVSASEPIDISPEDNQQQREEKLREFSRSRSNVEYSVMMNFTGDETKKYELSYVYASDSQLNSERKVENVYSKIQLSYIMKNSNSQSKPRTCLIAAYDRPQVVGDATVGDVAQAIRNSQIETTVALNSFEGSSCKKSDRPQSKTLVNMTVTEPRVKALLNISSSDDSIYNKTEEFYRLAVYDTLHLESSWQSPSPQLQNITLRLRDLVEGYLFPKIVKNYLAPNSAGKMVVDAQRSISDDRVEALIRTPLATLQVQRLNIHPMFDVITSFTPDVVTSSTPSPVIRSVASSDKCFVLPSHVRTFDGVSYQKKPTGCWTVALESLSGQLTVSSRMTQERKQEVKIQDSEKRLEILIDGESVKVNNQQMSEESKQIKSRSGNVIAHIIRKESSVQVSIIGEMELEVRQGSKMMIKLDPRLKSSVMALCGNYNGIPSDDLKDRKGCYYSPSQGPTFATSWIVDRSQCHESAMTPLFDTTRHYQKHCPKEHSSLSGSESGCKISAYPITEEGNYVCVAVSRGSFCKPICTPTVEYTSHMSSKCWIKGTEPKDLTDNLEVGYITEPVTTSAPVTKQVQYRLAHECKPITTLMNSNDCYVSPAYPVRRSGPLLCITQDPTTQCKSTCNVQDTVPTKMVGNCWNEDKAPETVKVAVRQGYTTSKVSDSAQFTQDMYVPVPRYCTSSSVHH